MYRVQSDSPDQPRGRSCLGELNHPYGVSVTPDGQLQLYVSDSWNQRIVSKHPNH